MNVRSKTRQKAHTRVPCNRKSHENTSKREKRKRKTLFIIKALNTKLTLLLIYIKNPNVCSQREDMEGVP